MNASHLRDQKRTKKSFAVGMYFLWLYTNHKNHNQIPEFATRLRKFLTVFGYLY